MMVMMMMRLLSGRSCIWHQPFLLPSSPTYSDCRRLIFSFNVDTVLLTDVGKYYYAHGALSDDAVWRLSVWRLSRRSGRRAVCAAGRLDGAYWLIGPGSAVLAQGCRCALPLQAWAVAYRGGRPPTACYYKFATVKFCFCYIFALFCSRWFSLCPKTRQPTRHK